jgi:hypothetical protein
MARIKHQEWTAEVDKAWREVAIHFSYAALPELGAV